MDVAVGKYAFIDIVFFDQFRQFFFRENRNSFRIQFPREFSRIFSSIYIRNLCSGECHNMIQFIVTIIHVEVVKVSSSRSNNNDVFSLHCYLPYILWNNYYYTYNMHKNTNETYYFFQKRLNYVFSTFFRCDFPIRMHDYTNRKPTRRLRFHPFSKTLDCRPMRKTEANLFATLPSF